MGLLFTQSSRLILTLLCLSCVSSVTIGLLISVLAGDSQRGHLYLSFVVVFMVLFSGLIRNDKLQDLINSLSVFSTGRWAFEALVEDMTVGLTSQSAIFGLYCWTDDWHFEEFNSIGHVASVYLALRGFRLWQASRQSLYCGFRDPWSSFWSNFHHIFVNDWRPTVIYLSVIGVFVSFTMFFRQTSLNITDCIITVDRIMEGMARFTMPTSLQSTI